MNHRWIIHYSLLLIAMTTLISACSSSEDSVKMGKTVFDRNCSECHSMNPDAPTQKGPSLAYLFSVSELRKFLSNGKELNIQNVKVLISTGYGEMPGTALEPDQMDALIEYLMYVSEEE